MKEIIIAYPKKSTAMQLRLLLEQEGFHVGYICALGSSVLSIAQELNEGVIVSSASLSDMTASAIAENLPAGFDVVSLSRNGREAYMGNLISLSLPIQKQELIETVAVLVNSRSAFTRRNNDDSEILSNAKLILMKSNSITESQAHKYLQNESMKTGKKIIELAKEIINEFTE